MASDSSDEDFDYPIVTADDTMEEAINPYLQLVSHFVNLKRAQRYNRKIRRTAAPRKALFCKRALTLAHASMAARFATPRPIPAVPHLAPVRLSDRPDLLALRPISVSDLTANDTTHAGRILFGTLCVDPFVSYGRGQMSVLEPPQEPGAAVRIAVYNFRALYPPGSKVAIREPCFKSGMDGIRVDDPSMTLVVVESFPLPLVVEGMEALRRRGNVCWARGQLREAAELYTRCIDKLPADAPNGEKGLVECVVPVYSNRAMVYLRMGEWEKAVGDADKALEMEPGHLKCLFRKGRALEEMGKYEEAAVWLGKAEKAGGGKVEEIAAALERVRIKSSDECSID